jgi:hypothetical protein
VSVSSLSRFAGKARPLEEMLAEFLELHREQDEQIRLSEQELSDALIRGRLFSDLWWVVLLEVGEFAVAVPAQNDESRAESVALEMMQLEAGGIIFAA